MNDVTQLSSHPLYQDYAGHRFRDEWIDVVAAIPDQPRSVYQTGIRLFRHFKCTTGQCNPSYETIAAEIGTKKRTVERAVKVLEAVGLVKPPPPHAGVKRGFELTIPSEVATTTVAGSSDNSCRMSKPKKRAEVATRNAKSSDTKPAKVATTAVAQNTENTGTLKSGAPAPRSVLVDSQSDLTEETTDTISAPYGADVTHGKEPAAMLTPEQINSIAEQILNEGGFGKADFANLIGHLDKADKFTVIIKYQEIEQQRKAEIAA